jgi:hypothetical protein
MLASAMLSGALALTLLFAQTPTAPTRREDLLFANCPRQAGEYSGSFRGRVVLHKELLAGDDPRTSIEHQLRYLWGHYRNDASAHAALQVVLSAEPPEIHIVSRKEVPYGLSLALPYPTKDPRLAIDDAYTRRAVARGQVKAGDAAWLVEYEIRFKTAVCGRGQDPPPVARVPLPRDPWLAYWHVPRDKHRPLSYFVSREITNPCADDDFADLPHPFYYWYDWLPTRHGPDDDGHPFDCRQWLHAGRDYDFFDVKLDRVADASRDVSRLRAQLGQGELTATIMVGAVDHGVKDLDPARWRALLGESSAGELPARATSALVDWDARPPHEPGTRSYLGLLEELRGVMNIDRHTAAVDDGYLVTEVRGHLKRSGRAARVRVWLGMTDVFGPLPPRHWRILRRALAEDQIVVYWGHAGIGENFRLAQIEQHLGLSHAQMSAELRGSPLRLVAFLSCYSYMYFGQDLLDAGAERSTGTYFIFTGIGKARHEAGPLAVLDLVDRVVQPDNREGRIDRLPMLGDDEFWLLKEVTGPATKGR